MSKFVSYQLQNFLRLFAISFGSLSVTFAILYYGLKWSYPIAALYRMFAYQNQHPFQYIAIISGVFALVGIYWINYCGKLRGYLRWLTMTVAMLMSVIISSPFGGILWQIHDSKHGFMPDNYLGKIYEGIRWGFECGWLIVLLSVPMNLVGLTVGYATLHRLAKSSKHSR
jgi:hypothetical protein